MEPIETASAASGKFIGVLRLRAPRRDGVGLALDVLITSILYTGEPEM